MGDAGAAHVAWQDRRNSNYDVYYRVISNGIPGEEVRADAGTARIDDLIPVVYADVDEERQAIARHSMHAHLIKLAADGKVTGKTLTGKWSVA